MSNREEAAAVAAAHGASSIAKRVAAWAIERDDIAQELSRLVMRMSEGSDIAYDKAAKLVKKHYRSIYDEFE